MRFRLIVSIVVSVVVALALVRVVIFRAFYLPTGGMEKTILRGDYVAANMAAYGLRVPFTDSILRARPPQRGDIIVFRFPEERSQLFIKRVVGLPGESVAVRGPGVYIDGKLLPERYAVFGGGPYSEPAPLTQPLPERLEDGEPGDPIARAYGPETVPEGMLFVMGDNRDNSRDSRYWGFLPLEDVRGKAWYVYFSKDPRTGAVRWDRMGETLH